MSVLPWLAASYLLGAVPSSYLAGRLVRGIDLREHGSRNLGATNLYRVLGWRFAIPVGLFDMAKGLVPAQTFFDLFDDGTFLGSMRQLGKFIVHVLDDHDMSARPRKQRFAAHGNAPNRYHQVAHVVGIQLTTPVQGPHKTICHGTTGPTYAVAAPSRANPPPLRMASAMA
jgi:hypothetical protein